MVGTLSVVTWRLNLEVVAWSCLVVADAPARGRRVGMLGVLDAWRLNLREVVASRRSSCLVVPAAPARGRKVGWLVDTCWLNLEVVASRRLSCFTLS